MAILATSRTAMGSKVRVSHSIRRAPFRAYLKTEARLGGGSVLDRPSTDLGKGWRGGDSARGVDVVTTLPRLDTDGGSGNEDPLKGTPRGGGNYRVLLLDSPKHTEPLVIQAITKVVPGTDDTHAKNCYHTSKQLGMAIVTTCLKEHAEFYQQQLYRYGCRASIEPDNVTA